MVLLVGCSKDAELDVTSGVGEAVSFTISDVIATRATVTDAKTSWTEGDALAIFDSAEDDATAKCYKIKSVDGSYVLESDPNESDGGYVVSTTTTTYTAYYPYEESYTKLSDYQALSDNNDILTSTASTTSGEATFDQFTHANCYITFSVTLSGYNSVSSMTLTLKDGTYVVWTETTSNPSTSTSNTYSSYRAPSSDGSDYTVNITVNSEDTRTRTFDKWEAGKAYTYEMTMTSTSD